MVWICQTLFRPWRLASRSIRAWWEWPCQAVSWAWRLVVALSRAWWVWPSQAVCRVWSLIVSSTDTKSCRNCSLYSFPAVWKVSWWMASWWAAPPVQNHPRAVAAGKRVGYEFWKRAAACWNLRGTMELATHPWSRAVVPTQYRIISYYFHFFEC